MTTHAAPMCVGCKHFLPAAERLACAAYPGVIPDAIIMSVADHRGPYAGDHGIHFEPKAPEDAKYAASLFERPRKEQT
jgi:hypothetical protein